MNKEDEDILKLDLPEPIVIGQFEIDEKEQMRIDEAFEKLLRESGMKHLTS